jgi:heptosyltransferase-2
LKFGFKNVLFISEGQLGDCIVLTPAIRALKETFPQIRITILIIYRRNYAFFWNGNKKQDTVNPYITESSFRGTAEVFKNNPYVDKLLELDRGALKQIKGYRRIKTELMNIIKLRKHRFDTVICSFPEDRFSLYAFLSGAKIRTGEKPAAFSFLLNRKLNITQEDGGVLRYFLNIVTSLGANVTSYDTYFSPSAESLQLADEFIKQNGLENSSCIIGVHPGSSQNDRKWEADKFAELVNLVNADFILLYSDFDIEFISEIKKHLSRTVYEVKTDSISDLAALISKCNFCIMNSSGPRHLAASLGIPVIGLFYKTDDLRWGIYDKERYPVIKTRKPCNACPSDKCLAVIPEGKFSSFCMRDIDFGEVLSKTEEFILLYGKSEAGNVIN